MRNRAEYYRQQYVKRKPKMQAYFAENRDRLLKQMREYKQHKRGTDIAWVKRVMFNNAKSRAKTRGIPFTIKFEDVYWPSCCPVFKTSFNFWGSLRRGYSDWLPSFDRIDPKKGYVPGNVQIISARANRLKCDATVDELRRVVDYMEIFS